MACWMDELDLFYAQLKKEKKFDRDDKLER